MNKIIDKVEKAKIATDIKLLAPPTNQTKHVLNDDVKSYQEKLEGFGINNVTTKALNAVKTLNNKIEQENYMAKEEYNKQHGLTLLTNMFSPFAVISYATMHQIAKDYNLIISSLSFYNKVIEEDNLDEMEGFREHIVELVEKTRHNVEIPEKKMYQNSSKYKEMVNALCDPFKRTVTFLDGKDFTFDEYAEQIYLESLDFSKCLNIIAPESHFDFKGQNVVACGREVKPYFKKPNLKFEFKVNIPEPKDPIVTLPFLYMKEIYFIIVTSWDKVADDSRIRAQLPVLI